ncbi:MAG: hypothetical protein M1826_004245 [Phylliscum demangeonii]|nr:MAG: hypothetical protein M1826_004245 [Phylliscum demangeonii]
MACGVQSDVERIERRRYLANPAMEYHNYRDSTSDEELLALVPARIGGVGHAKRAWKVYVMTMYPEINPDYIITGKLPANASPEAIEARESTRQLHNQLTEGRALLELGEGVFLLYPPNVSHDAILNIPRETHLAAIRSPQEILPALRELFEKAWEVHVRFTAGPEKAPRVRLELLPCDLIEDGMPVSSLSVLELLDTVTVEAVAEEMMTPRAKRVAHHVLSLLPPDRKPTIFEQFKANYPESGEKLSAAKWKKLRKQRDKEQKRLDEAASASTEAATIAAGADDARERRAPRPRQTRRFSKQ